MKSAPHVIAVVQIVSMAGLIWADASRSSHWVIPLIPWLILCMPGIILTLPLFFLMAAAIGGGAHDAISNEVAYAVCLVIPTFLAIGCNYFIFAWLRSRAKPSESPPGDALGDNAEL